MVILSLLTSAATLEGADVVFYFGDFRTATEPLTNKVLTIQPTNSTPRANGNQIITSDRFSFTNDGSASVTVSNMVTSSYHCIVRGPFSYTAFQITVPETNALLNAKDLISVNTNAPPGLAGYSMTAADARFVLKSNGWSSGQALTNGHFNGSTNFFTVPTNNVVQGTSVLAVDTNGNVFAGIGGGGSTNGLATTNYVNAITNGLATTNYVNAATNAFADKVDETSGVSTNQGLYWTSGTVRTILTNDNGGGIQFYSTDAGQVLRIDNAGTTTFGQADVIFNLVTANRAAIFNGTKRLTSSSVTDTELGYLSGVTSALQGQMDNKVDEGNGVATNVSLFGSVTNYGTLTNAGVVTFAGNVTNFGQERIRGGLTVDTFIFDNDDLTVVRGITTGTLTNQGYFTNTGPANFAGQVTNWNTVRNKAGVTNDSNVRTVGAVENQSTITNTGAINNAAGATNWANTLTIGAVENRSTVTNTGAINNAAGVTNWSNARTVGAVENQSTITNSGAANFAAGVTNWANELTIGAVENRSTITNTGAANFAAGVTNWSNVRNVGAVENQSTITNMGGANFAAGVTNWSNVRNVGAVENQSTITNTGAANFAAAVTNWNDTVVQNHMAVGGFNTATNRYSASKTRFLALTNSTGGWADWMAGTPNPARRNWFSVWAFGANVNSVGCQSAASIGSLANAEGSTNEWPVFSYSTAASSLSSNGICSATTATTLSMHPGKNNYFCFVGRISQMSTQRWWIGYSSATTATMGADSDTPTSSHIAMIRLSSAASGALTNWALVTCDGSACTATAAGPVSLTTTNVHVFEIMEDRPNTRWLAYVDGTVIATNSANLPSTAMRYVIQLSTLEAVAKTFRGSVIYGEMDNRIDGNIVYYP